MTIEIVDLPINSMVIFYSYVKLPESMGYNMGENGGKTYMVNMSPDFFVLSPICKPSGEARCFTIWGNVKTKKCYWRIHICP